MNYLIYDNNDNLIAKTEADSSLAVAEKLYSFFGDDAVNYSIEENDAWSDAPELDNLFSVDEKKITADISDLTATFIADDGRKWYRLNGYDNGTGIEIDNEEFAIAEDDSILDCDGCPLTPGDRQEVAVRDAIEKADK